MILVSRTPLASKAKTWAKHWWQKQWDGDYKLRIGIGVVGGIKYSIFFEKKALTLEAICLALPNRCFVKLIHDL